MSQLDKRVQDTLNTQLGQNILRVGGTDSQQQSNEGNGEGGSDIARDSDFQFADDDRHSIDAGGMDGNN